MARFAFVFLLCYLCRCANCLYTTPPARLPFLFNRHAISAYHATFVATCNVTKTRIAGRDRAHDAHTRHAQRAGETSSSQPLIARRAHTTAHTARTHVAAFCRSQTTGSRCLAFSGVALFGCLSNMDLSTAARAMYRANWDAACLLFDNACVPCTSWFCHCCSKTHVPHLPPLSHAPRCTSSAALYLSTLRATAATPH